MQPKGLSLDAFRVFSGARTALPLSLISPLLSVGLHNRITGTRMLDSLCRGRDSWQILPAIPVRAIWNKSARVPYT